MTDYVHKPGSETHVPREALTPLPKAAVTSKNLTPEEIANLQVEVEWLRAYMQQMNDILKENVHLHVLVDAAQPMIEKFARDNPRWTHPERGEQDPYGVHAWLAGNVGFAVETSAQKPLVDYARELQKTREALAETIEYARQTMPTERYRRARLMCRGIFHTSSQKAPVPQHTPASFSTCTPDCPACAYYRAENGRPQS